MNGQLSFLKAVAALGIAYGLRPWPAPTWQRFVLTFGIWGALTFLDRIIERNRTR